MSNSNQEIETPLSFVRAVEQEFQIEFHYDMAANRSNKKAPVFYDDSLNIDWPLEGWLWLNPPTVTDKWGKEIIQDKSIQEILEKELTEFWNQDVDDSGRRGNSGYGNKIPRFQWMIDQRIEASSKTFADKLTRDTENKIKSNMKEALQNSIGKKLVGELGFDQLLLENKN